MEFNMAVSTWRFQHGDYAKENETKAKTKKPAISKQSISLKDIQTLSTSKKFKYSGTLI